MGHSTSQVQLGVVTSSGATKSVHGSDPAGFPAGRAVSLSSANALSLLASAGNRIGISLGKSLSDTKKTSVCRTGHGVPVELALKRARGVVTITSVANLVSGTDDAIVINGTSFVAQAGAATPGDATFQATGTVTATAQSLVAQINAHATIGALVRASNVAGAVTIAAIEEGADGNAITLAYTESDGNVGATVSGATLTGGSDTTTDIDYVTKGTKVYIDNYSGKATANLPGATISDAIYVAGLLTGFDESATQLPASLIDMPGGL